MNFRNYFSKISFIYSISAHFITFFNLLIHSKKYSKTYKNNNLQLNKSDVEEYQLKVNTIPFRFYMRTFSGDIDIFYEIFWKNIYKIENYNKIKNPEIIVDLGAHIGNTSLYFALEYPNATIISVEASEENFALLTKNCNPFQNISTIYSAAYPTDGFVYFEQNGLSYNHKIASEGVRTPTISIYSLMKKFGLSKIDLLKIDIEGAENLLLTENNHWLANVDNIIIEIHPPFGFEDLKKILKPYSFTLFIEKNAIIMASKIA